MLRRAETDEKVKICCQKISAAAVYFGDMVSKDREVYKEHFNFTESV